MIITISEAVKVLNIKGKLMLLSFNATVRQNAKLLWNKMDFLIKKLENDLLLDTINTNPAIYATREAYKKFGKDPSRYRPSADSLRRRIVKGLGLYKVNNVVDILNYISLKTGISIGGYNTDLIVGEVFLDIGKISDDYNGIGRGKLNIEGLPVLYDSKGPFGSPTSDSERTMLHIGAKSITFVYFDFENATNIEDIINETKELLTDYTEAKNFDIKKIYLQ